jgi:hypothetical protein
MSSNIQRYYAGQGKIFLAPRNASGVAGDYRWIGDVSTFEISIAQKFIDDYESWSGMRAPTIHIPTQVDVNVALTVKSVSKENLTAFLYGSSSTSTGASVTAEAHTSYAIGGVVALKNPKVSAVSVHKGVTALVADTDYTLNATMGSITILTSTGVGDLTVDYTFASNQFAVEGLTQTIKNYALRFEGINLDNNDLGKNVLANVWNVPIDMLTKLGLIDVSKAQELPVSGKALPAAEITAAGASQYFNYVSF